MSEEFLRRTREDAEAISLEQLEELKKEIQKEFEKKDKRIDELETRLEKLRTNSTVFEKKSIETDSGVISRREFLKKAGLGFGSLAAFALPVKALDIRDSDLNVYTGEDRDTISQSLAIDHNQDVKIPNGELIIQEGLDMRENDISNVGKINGRDTSELADKETILAADLIFGGP